ncbi:MAG: alpha/beta fold hydrolase [Planktomarina sp.]
MPYYTNGSVTLHYLDDGPKDGPAVVFAGALGTNAHMWDHVIAHMPKGLRLIRYDKRGHGLSDVPKPPYSMGALVKDAECLMDHLHLSPSVFVGISIGGMIAQGLAAKRPDLIKAAVFSNTGAKIGTRAIWEDRINTTRKLGMKALAPQILERWFASDILQDPIIAPIAGHLESMTTDGYTGCAAAIQGTDFITPTSGLHLPVLGIAGGRDNSTPADMVFELCGLVHGAEVKVIPRSGHLPPIDAPETYANLLNAFLEKIGHSPA